MARRPGRQHHRVAGGPRLTPDLFAVDETRRRRLLALGTATLGESGGRPLAGGTVAPVWAGAAVAGAAFPVVCAAGDNLAVQVAVTEAPPGAVLVVHVEGEPAHGYWGEVLTVAAQARGLAGLLIDGCVRDTAALAARAFPVFAAGVALPGTTKHGPGAVGRRALVGGADVRPGDVVVADEDGVVVVAAAEVDDVLAAGDARAAKEAGWFEALGSGSTTVLDLLGIDDTGTVARP